MKSGDAEGWLFALKIITALGCGLIAGVFFAFSTFVMSALARLPAAQSISAMQSINVTVINPAFMGVFMGTALACLVLGVAALLNRHGGGRAFILAGCLLYLIGVFGVTAAGNVPLNDALAKVQPDSPAGAAMWASYLKGWTLWNHVRMASALAAAASFILSLCRSAAR